MTKQGVKVIVHEKVAYRFRDTVTHCSAHGDERAERWSGLLCRQHRRRMDDDVREIGLLIVDSQRIVDGGAPKDSGPQGGKQKKRADPPAPGNVELMTMLDPRTAAARIKPDPERGILGDDSPPSVNVLAVVASWLLLVADERPLTATKLPQSVLAQLDLLLRHHEWMAEQLWIDDYLLEMAELRSALRSLVADQKFFRKGRCPLYFEQEEFCRCYCHANGSATCSIDKGHAGKVPYCGPHEKFDVACTGTLLEENGAGTVKCTTCKTRWVSDQELARLTVMLEEKRTA